MREAMPMVRCSQVTDGHLMSQGWVMAIAWPLGWFIATLGCWPKTDFSKAFTRWFSSYFHLAGDINKPPLAAPQLAGN